MRRIQESQLDMDEVAPPEQVVMTVGEKLRAAREASGKTLTDIASQTRVAERMLDALERNAVSELPPGPYATGFARNFARAVGLNENEVAAEIKALIQPVSTTSTFAFDQFEPVATNRVPSRALAWTAVLIAVMMVGAYLLWTSYLLNPAIVRAGDSPAAATAQGPAQPAVSAAPAVAVDDNAVVRIAASERVWFSLEDAQGRGQFDLTLDGGEFYTLKPQQRSMTLRTGRPQSLRIMVGEVRVPQLGADDAVVSGVALDTASLTARINAPAAVTPPATGQVGP